MLATLVVLSIGMQEGLPPAEAQIERAIKAGTDALIRACRPEPPGDIPVNDGMGFDFNALMLYTLVHSGLGLRNDTVQVLLKKTLAAPLVRTYQVAMIAAALAAIDPVKYQGRLTQCAQYLVDFQADNGQWGYGEAYEPAAKTASSDGGGANRTVAKIRIRRSKKLGPAAGDNSNSQYAALGLKACATAACDIDPSVLSRAIEWWGRSQLKSGGWSYSHDGVLQEKSGAYGSMTAGAVSSLIMLRLMKNSDPKLDPSVTRGVAWLADHFTVDSNPSSEGERQWWHYYYLYAIERVGDLYPTEKIGRNRWYAMGADFLLKSQKEDGTWQTMHMGMTLADTCFALLFLERVARRPPVATGGKEAPPEDPSK